MTHWIGYHYRMLLIYIYIHKETPHTSSSTTLQTPCFHSTPPSNILPLNKLTRSQRRPVDVVDRGRIWRVLGGAGEGELRFRFDFLSYRRGDGMRGLIEWMSGCTFVEYGDRGLGGLAWR